MCYLAFLSQSCRQLFKPMVEVPTDIFRLVARPVATFLTQQQNVLPLNGRLDKAPQKSDKGNLFHQRKR